MTDAKNNTIQENTVYYRTVIPTEDGYCSARNYIINDNYAKNALSYIRAFELIQQDLINLFNYIEPDKGNLKCYSLNIYRLFVTTCIELEQNFKAILQENKLTNNNNNWNIKTYSILETTHKLSHYKVILPLYRSESFASRTPFEKWQDNGSLLWYKAYSNLKHARIDNFKEATLENLLDAICGLLVILSAQFFDGAVYPRPGEMMFKDKEFNIERKAIGGYFDICFPPLKAWKRVYNITDRNNLKICPNPDLETN